MADFDDIKMLSSKGTKPSFGDMTCCGDSLEILSSDVDGMGTTTSGIFRFQHFRIVHGLKLIPM
jgi:hypothetical protein